MRNWGYTLIELMVVVAIIGLFVGVAVPSYKNYMVKSRVATGFDVMKYYSQLGQEYYEANGVFGNAQAIGLEVGATPNAIDNPQSINKYTTSQIVDVDDTNACYNNIRFTFDGTALGITQSFDIQMLVRNVDGLFQVSCGIPWNQDANTYADVLQYFPESCKEQNVSTCAE